MMETSLQISAKYQQWWCISNSC